MFQQVLQTAGQKEPGTNYPLKTEIKAIIQDVKGIEYSKTSGKPGQSLYLRDEQGEIQWVKLQGKFDALTKANKGEWHTFLVWAFQPQSSPKAYLYCWIQNQQSTPQTPQNVPQSTNSGQGMTATTETLDVLYKILAAIKDLQPFEKKYDLETPESTENSDDVPW